jgi:hypothetical protein
LEKRLARVEARLSARTKPPEVNAAAVWERLLSVMGRGDPGAVRRALEGLPTWQALIPTMDPQHVAIVLDVFAGEDWVRERTGRSNLALTVYHVLSRVWDGPLALPKAVADVYLNDPDTLPIHKCEACGYRIPTHIGSGAEQREVYFAECPLCGGRIHWELMLAHDSPVGPDGYPLRAPATAEGQGVQPVD